MVGKKWIVLLSINEKCESWDKIWWHRRGPLGLGDAQEEDLTHDWDFRLTQTLKC